MQLLSLRHSEQEEAEQGAGHSTVVTEGGRGRGVCESGDYAHIQYYVSVGSKAAVPGCLVTHFH